MVIVPGRSSRISTLLLRTPVDSGYNPERKDAREGPQTGYWQKALRNRTLSAANRSNAGVSICSYPQGEMWVFRSSQTMKSMLGAFLSAAKETNEQTRREIIRVYGRIFLDNERLHPSGQVIIVQTNCPHLRAPISSCSEELAIPRSRVSDVNNARASLVASERRIGVSSKQ